MKKTCYSLLINNWKDESGFVDRFFDRCLDQQGQNLMITAFAWNSADCVHVDT